MRRLVVVVVLASCSAQPARVPASGTRIAQRTFTFVDGDVLVDRGVLLDLARDEACTAERWSDGLTYCTPAAGEVVYADSQCLTPVARLPIDSTAKYAAERGFDGQIARLYRTFEPYGTSAGEVWRLDHGSCVGTFESDEAATLVLGDEQPRDDFARITANVRGDGRLQIVELTSDDGLVLPARFHDRTVVADCIAARAPGAPQAPCIPTSTVTAHYFADAACTRPVAEITTTTMPAAITYTDAAGCTIHAALGDEVPAAALWTADACLPVAGHIDHRYIAAGAPLDLAQVTRRIEHTDARMRRIDLDPRRDAASELTDALAHDTALAIDCAPTMMIDGTLRCMPDAIAAESEVRYADAGCSQRIDVVSLGKPSCGQPAQFVVDGAGTWRHLDQPITDTLYVPAETSCVSVAEGPHTWQVGAPISPDAFAPVTTAPSM